MRHIQVNKQEKEDIYPSELRGSYLTQRESNYLRRRKRHYLLPFNSSEGDNH
jgi:hypothetical protein